MEGEPNRSNKGMRGFTTVEVITVLVIISILSAVAVTRIVTPRSFSLAAEADIVKTHLRYVHFRALSDVGTWGVSFAGSSYTVMRDGSIAGYRLPNEDSPTHTFPSGITTTEAVVTFDEWGTPVDGARNPVMSDITVHISGGGETVPVTVTKGTGFVP
jgi:prepilin-type N-terminal cleavage/methylation domain-containing protein